MPDDDLPRQAGEVEHVEARSSDHQRGAEVRLALDEVPPAPRSAPPRTRSPSSRCVPRTSGSTTRASAARAIFASSEGWMRVMPRLSQRREPLTTMPNIATATSSTTADDVERHGGARERLRRDVGDDPHERPARPRGSRAACARASTLWSAAENSVTRPTTTITIVMPNRNLSIGRATNSQTRADELHQSLRDQSGSRRSPGSVGATRAVAGPGSAARRAGSSRAPGARSAPPPARRSRRSRPARRARCAACPPARRP